jgi:hypothetical protein
MTSPLATALAYAQKRGWPVFPSELVRQPNGKLDKVPRVKWKEITTPDPAQIERWWRRWPNAVISIPTGRRSGTVILDIDCKEGRWGFDTLEELGRSILPDTPIAHTPSGGVHVFFGCIDLEIRNSAGIKGLGVGLDIRGEGGQVVLPSPNAGYWWDPHCNFDTKPLLPAPAWLGYRPPKKRPPITPGPRISGRRLDPQAILAEPCRRIEQAPDGTKHDTYRQETFRIATMVRDRLLTEADARHALEPVIMALGKRADGHYNRVEKYYNLAFAEGLAAAGGSRLRR